LILLIRLNSSATDGFPKGIFLGVVSMVQALALEKQEKR
jgi:hypothetical protein